MQNNYNKNLLNLKEFFTNFFNIFYFIKFFQFSSLNPINIFSLVINIGLFISIPSLANNSILSLLLIIFNLSLRFNCLYFSPLVLNHFFISCPLNSIHFSNSSIIGVSVTIFLSTSRTFWIFYINIFHYIYSIL